MSARIGKGKRIVHNSRRVIRGSSQRPCSGHPKMAATIMCACLYARVSYAHNAGASQGAGLYCTSGLIGLQDTDEAEIGVVKMRFGV